MSRQYVLQHELPTGVIKRLYRLNAKDRPPSYHSAFVAAYTPDRYLILVTVPDGKDKLTQQPKSRISFLGGRKDKEDRDKLFTTISREAYEEGRVRLQLASLAPVGYVETLEPNGRSYKRRRTVITAGLWQGMEMPFIPDPKHSLKRHICIPAMVDPVVREFLSQNCSAREKLHWKDVFNGELLEWSYQALFGNQAKPHIPVAA